MRFLLFLAFLPQLALAQFTISGTIRDVKNKQPIAFTNIVGPNQTGAVSDIDGRFSFKVGVLPATLSISCLGYNPQKITVNSEDNLAIELAPNTLNLSEVLIRPGENPAWRIIRKASANRKENNPEKSLQFSYKSYNKLFFTFDANTINADDTSARSTKELLEKSYIFFTETYALRNYASASKNKETILATRISGLKNASFGIIATELQSFSFYDDLITINAKKYINPLSKNSENQYRFELIDTSYAGSDTVFIISYYPKEGKNFEALKGRLYINTNGYAVQNVTATPTGINDSLNILVSIQQQYKMIAGKWFPEQLNTYITSPFQGDSKSPGMKMVGEGRSYISEVQINPMFAKDAFGFVNSDIASDAGAKKEDFWLQNRVLALNEKEKFTYQYIDSIGKIAKLDTRLKILEYLVDGKVPYKIVSFHLNDLLKINQVESYRLGLGLSTNNRLSKYFSVGAYAGYGFKDKRAKYRGDITLFLAKDDRLNLKAQYLDDLAEPGAVNYETPQGILKQQEFRKFLLNRLDELRQITVSLQIKPSRNITLVPFVNEQQRSISGYNYQFEERKSSALSLLSNQFYTQQIGADLRLSFDESTSRLFGKVLTRAGKYPVIQLRYTKSGINNTTIAFDKLDFQFDHNFSLKLLGTFSYRISAGYVSEVAPYPFLYNGKGNRSDFFGVNSFGSFETMRFNEFLSDRYAAIFVSHDFKSLLFKTEKFKPKLLLCGNVMIGSLQNESAHQGIDFKVPERIYAEAGFIINDLFKSNNFSSIGIGLFHRVGNYQLAKPIDNFALKLSSVISID